MNLKEKLEEHKRNKTILLVKGRGFGQVEEVGDDYIVFRSAISEAEESWFSDDIKYKYSGTTRGTISFAGLEFSVHPRMEWAKEKFREAELNDSKTKSEGCFIATQVYGEYAEETNLLRRFRDETLLRTYLGKLLINVYYGISPSISDFIFDKPILKKITRRLLDVFIWQLKIM